MARAATKKKPRDVETISNVDIDNAFIKLAREDSSAFCSYVMRDPSGKRFKQAPLHNRWHDLLRKHKNLILWGSVECGKAIPLTTPIPTPVWVGHHGCAAGWRSGVLFRGNSVQRHGCD